MYTGTELDKSSVRSFLAEPRAQQYGAEMAVKQVITATRQEKIEMIERLVQKGELRCARLCCQSWNIADNVFRKFVREHGTEEQKELWLH